MHDIETKREQAILAKEQGRIARERVRVANIKSATRQRVHSTIKSKNDILRRLDLLPSNRELLRGIVKYKRRMDQLDSVEVNLEVLQDCRGMITGDKIKFSLL
jgi:hypothetical protein